MALYRKVACSPVCLYVLLSGFILGSCSRGTKTENQLPADSAQIAAGAVLFQQNCSSCHSFDQDGIGPRLGGVAPQVPADWLRRFIKDPQAIVASGDERATKLLEKYQVYMPAFSWYSEQELDQLLAFMSTHEAWPSGATTAEGALDDPIPDSIPLSELVVNLELLTQIPPSSDNAPATRIVNMDFIPGSNRMFVLDLRGKLYELVNAKPQLYLDIAERFPAFINQPGLATGFGSFAFHPEFLQNGLLYTTHTEAAATAPADFSYADSIPVHLQWVLSEWKTNAPDHSPLQATRSRELIRVDMVKQLHGVQEIKFNPLSRPGDEDYGLLYIGVGDGGCVEAGFPFLTHSPEKIWGTIIRIDPAGRNSRNGRYGIPASNPFAGDQNPSVLQEIYAYGFRNPHRFSWSSLGQLLATNIGHSHIESINLIEPGHDYGWPLREGTFVLFPEKDMNKLYPLPADDEQYGITYPVAQYDHSEGNAISGGFEYKGNKVASLKGKYLFGDIPRGKLFYVEMSDLKQGSLAPIKEWRVAVGGQPVQLDELCGDKRVDVRFGEGPDGELYLFTKPDGKIYRLTR